jgi:hypothetical protein
MILRDRSLDCLVNPSAVTFEPERFDHFVSKFLICPQASIGFNPVN